MIEPQKKEKLRIGITQRSIVDGIHNEKRDTLAQDWHSFLQNALPDIPWVPIPNIEKNVIDFINEFDINRFIFSGGETPGTSPKRDTTERYLLELAIRRKIPTICVCRGMQFLVNHIGEELISCEKELHAGVTHEIRWFNEEKLVDSRQTVNSFHEVGIKNTKSLQQSVEVCAFASVDKTVEAIKLRDANIHGIMWHPEREAKPKVSDIEFFREVFRAKA